ncbi:hypothetical protein [Phenylobacterium sp.]|jgi:hypothetical protein|uniref:hypothetical protein n=1 Tax=Phenylobacterium sp. TaxID=1871053 RepID=UPI002F3EE38A
MAMAEPDLLGAVPSTVKRPPAKQLRAFHLGMIDPTHTVRLYLARGYSLAICCRACDRLTEWTPPDLCERFEKTPDLPVRAIAARLRCAGAGGCGSSDIVVWPHLFDGMWTWR